MSPDGDAGSGAGRRPAAIEVRPLQAREGAAWDAFVAARPDAAFFHRRAWGRVIEASMGHKALELAAWRGSRLIGILPLTWLRSRLFGDALVSAGFAVSGGILAEEPQAAAALAAAAVGYARTLRAPRVELRHETAAHLPPPWIERAGPYVGFKREISSSDEANLKAIPRKKRADLRKAIADDRLSITTAVDVGAFHRVYARSVRDLGTPVFPRRFFAAIDDAFGEDVEISAVLAPEGPVAAVMTFWNKNRAMPYFGGALPSARAYHAYDRLYWEVMRRAVRRGCSIFDFGRSKLGSGSHDYKTYWGFRPTPLAYQHLSLEGGAPPEINPLNPRYRLMIAAWKRLPLPVANALGPLFARQIG